MAAPLSNPIVSPTHYDPSFKVDVQLHQPMLSRGVTPSDVRLDMMSLCFQLETLCKKEIVQQAGVDNGHVSNSFIDRATVVYDRMVHLMAKVPVENQDCLIYMKWQGLDALFPRSVAYLKNTQNFSLDSSKTSMDSMSKPGLVLERVNTDYLTMLSQLSQLSTLARQIHNDCNNSSHKYIAHQLAILYQTISSIKSSSFSQHKQSIEDMFKSIKATLSEGGEGERRCLTSKQQDCQHKQSIEDMFKSIKATLSEGGEGERRCLTSEQQDWLFGITSSILQTLAAFPSDLTQDMLQPSLIFTRQHTR